MKNIIFELFGTSTNWYSKRSKHLRYSIVLPSVFILLVHMRFLVALLSRPIVDVCKICSAIRNYCGSDFTCYVVIVVSCMTNEYEIEQFISTYNIYTVEFNVDRSESILYLSSNKQVKLKWNAHKTEKWVGETVKSIIVCDQILSQIIANIW